MQNILAIDIGTTVFKAGIFSEDLHLIREATRHYDINLYDQGKADIDPEKWWHALVSVLSELKQDLSSIAVISFSVTTPGLLPMDKHGRALGPAILFLDQRSNDQAKTIQKTIGRQKLLQEACNLPVSGGSSLCSILWIRDHQPDTWRQTYRFGHTNTYLVHKLTGKWAVDPSTASITGLYHTRLNHLTWFEDALAGAGISSEQLPPLIRSHKKVGTILPDMSRRLGLPSDVSVLCGANDAVLGGLSAGITGPGMIANISGTCEIIAVCTDHPVGSPDYNVRCHVLPDKWLTFFVLNTGGKALEWFHSVFCLDMPPNDFYQTFIPNTIKAFLPEDPANDDNLPSYTPYLQGSRYSLEGLSAGFSGIRLETTREKMLLGLLRGNFNYLGSHLKKVSKIVPVKNSISTSGGVSKIKGMEQLKRRWMGDYRFHYRDQSSLLGAAVLGKWYLDDEKNDPADDESRHAPIVIKK